MYSNTFTPDTVNLDNPQALYDALAHGYVDYLLGAERLAALRANRSDDPDASLPLVHLRLEGTGCQWLLVSIDENDIAYGLCDPGTGNLAVMHTELRELLIQLAHRRDELRCTPDFRARAPFAEYTRQACLAGRIVLDWDGAPPLPEDSSGKAEDVIPLAEFLDKFRKPLLSQIEKQTPVVYNGQHDSWQDEVLAGLKRQPFPAQKHRIHACYAGLVTHNLPAVILNGAMGTGKTLMGICVSALMQHEYSRKPVLVIAPPHLVYKWRREILDTVPEASVTVINGSNAIRELRFFRQRLLQNELCDRRPHYLVIGRVRMRMGFFWRPAYWRRPYRFVSVSEKGEREVGGYMAVACPACGQYQMAGHGSPFEAHEAWGSSRREVCQNEACCSPLWTMRHRDNREEIPGTRLRQFLGKLPGIGKATTQKLIDTFGIEALEQLIDDNIYDFVNLQKADGDFFFNDRHAERLEKELGRQEFALRTVSYQPSEFVKRYFPRLSFSLVLVDEAHEYKNAGSAQGQAMAVLCGQAEKVLCLTGTLMGGYASDLFYLLFRAMPGVMTRLGFAANRHNSFASAETRFMRDYGCLIDTISKERDEGSYQTSKGRKVTVRTRKAPGFSPLGIARFVLPYTVFMRLTDLGEDILPEFTEETRRIAMTPRMQEKNLALTRSLTRELDRAIAKRDYTLIGVVINALLRWPETCFRAERITHPHNRHDVLAEADALFADGEPTPKEQDVIDLCLTEQVLGRRVIVYTVYTGSHDTSTRLRNLLQAAGLKAAVLRATVGSESREGWIADQVEKGIDVLITNPELVKTGLDLLAFPTLYFMQTGYNVYTVAQASRRSWRIGQKEAVKVYYACYAHSAQVQCLELMARKIKTALSTMGVMPETGLDAFIEDENSENSITEALAKQLLGRA